jgi:hypothetical protein
MANADKHNYTDFRNQGERRSMKAGADLASIYKDGKGSIFTNGAPPSPSGTARGLNEQISKGVDFFGVGRNHVGSLGSEQEATTVNVAGVGDKTTGKRGDYSQISGFTPKKKPMGESDYGQGQGGLRATCNSSWYTTGLDADAKALKYGTSGSISAFSSRALTTRTGGASQSSDGSGRGQSTRG